MENDTDVWSEGNEKNLVIDELAELLELQIKLLRFEQMMRKIAESSKKKARKS